MRDSRVHPTLNLTAPDPATAGLNIVTGTPAAQQVNLALVNAFGFGGQNSALLFAKWEGK
jgi:3-oxoacyl-[acyl-carrier-protein] synthase II